MGSELGLVIDRRQRGQADHGVDRRDRVRDVPHVGRASEPRHVAARLEERPAERLRVGAVERGERAIVHHLGIGGGRVVDAQRAAGCERARFEAAQDLAADVAEIAERARAHVVARGRVRGHDVGRLAAARDDAVDTVRGADVLAQQPDGGLRYHQRVARVHP
jgi:hypothetical protein